MKEKDKTYIMCNRLEMGHAVPDATQSNCAICDHPIWVSPSTSSIGVHHPEAITICTYCAMDRQGDEPIQPLTPEQMLEVAKLEPQFKLAVMLFGVEKARHLVAEYANETIKNYYDRIRAQRKAQTSPQTPG